MVIKKVLFILLGILSACNPKATETQVQQEDIKNRPLPTVNQLKGKPFLEAQRLLGKPGYGYDKEYPLSDASDEFRAPLFNYFNIEDSVDLKKRIREVTWPYGMEQDRRKLLTIWYVKNGDQWEYVDLYEWIQGVQF